MQKGSCQFRVEDIKMVGTKKAWLRYCQHCKRRSNLKMSRAAGRSSFLGKHSKRSHSRRSNEQKNSEMFHRMTTTNVEATPEVGEVAPVCAPIVLTRSFFLDRIGLLDILWAVHTLARVVTVWNRGGSVAWLHACHEGRSTILSCK